MVRILAQPDAYDGLVLMSLLFVSTVQMELWPQIYSSQTVGAREGASRTALIGCGPDHERAHTVGGSGLNMLFSTAFRGSPVTMKSIQWK
jgi:hypothetical protein